MVYKHWNLTHELPNQMIRIIKATEYFNKVIIHYSVFMQMMNINSDRLSTVLWHRGLGLVRLLQLNLWLVAFSLITNDTHVLMGQTWLCFLIGWVVPQFHWYGFSITFSYMYLTCFRIFCACFVVIKYTRIGARHVFHELFMKMLRA